MTDLLNMLHAERDSLTKQLAGIDAAIHALKGGSAAPAKTGVKKRTWKMSLKS